MPSPTVLLHCHDVPLSHLHGPLQGKDALMHACERGQVPIVRRLLRYNPAVHAKDNQVLFKYTCARVICIHTLQHWYWVGLPLPKDI